MTGWLATGGLPPGFVLEDECELRGPGEDGGVVRCKGEDLIGDEVRVHLNAGKQVTRLALSWNQRIGLLLQDDLTLRRLRFLDLVQEQVGSERTDTAEQVFDAEFALMTGELAQFLTCLIEGFGGVVQRA
jgi:recombination associated protein RdgC